MRPLDTTQSVTLFPKPVGWTLIVTSVGTALLGGAGIWISWVEGQWFMALLSGWLMPLGVWMTLVFLKRRNQGHLNPTLMLSPQGVHLMTGTTGVIPWPAVRGVGPYATRQLRGLVLKVDKSAFDALQQGTFFKASRKFDAAIGVHALVFFETQLEVPLPDLADMLHQYSIAHGGPALQLDP